MIYDSERQSYTQIATVKGSVAECGDKTWHGIYVRINHPTVFSFVQSGKIFIYTILAKLPKKADTNYNLL